MFQSGESRALHCSEGDVVPADGVLLEGIEVDGVSELTIVVLVVQSGLSVLADADEVLDVEHVGEVHVKVVLDVLDLIQPLLDEGVSPDSGEGEGLVVELPSVDSDVRVETLMSSHLVVDEHGSIVVLLVEGSGEKIDLLVELSLGDIDGRLTRSRLSKLLLNNGAVNGSETSDEGSHYR